MMKEVMLLTDFSENSFQAILYAMNLYEKEKVNFHILHIKDSRGLMLDDLMAHTPGESIQQTLLGGLKEKLKELLEKINVINTNELHQFKTVYLFDSFFEAINKYCKKENIKMLVMGTTGATGAKQIFLGSTAAKVIHQIDAPILAIPEGSVFSQIHKVLFSVDYKVNYLPVTLHPLVSLLKSFNPLVHMLYADEEQSEITDEQMFNKIEQHQILEEFNISTHKVTGLPLDHVLNCLVEFLQVNLLVMIKKNKSIFQKFINSSHIRKVSYHLKTPLLIIPEKVVLLD